MGEDMLEGILDGQRPSVVFRRLIAADASLGNIQLGELLWNEFPRLSGEAMQLTWHWQGPGKTQGLSDENLDALLSRLLVEAGYVESSPG
jgi:hypothetical protein